MSACQLVVGRCGRIGVALAVMCCGATFAQTEARAQECGSGGGGFFALYDALDFEFMWPESCDFDPLHANLCGSISNSSVRFVVSANGQVAGSATIRWSTDPGAEDIDIRRIFSWTQSSGDVPIDTNPFQWDDSGTLRDTLLAEIVDVSDAGDVVAHFWDMADPNRPWIPAFLPAGTADWIELKPVGFGSYGAVEVVAITADGTRAVGSDYAPESPNYRTVAWDLTASSPVAVQLTPFQEVRFVSSNANGVLSESRGFPAVTYRVERSGGGVQNFPLDPEAYRYMAVSGDGAKLLAYSFSMASFVVFNFDLFTSPVPPPVIGDSLFDPIFQTARVNLDVTRAAGVGRLPGSATFEVLIVGSDGARSLTSETISTGDNPESVLLNQLTDADENLNLLAGQARNGADTGWIWQIGSPGADTEPPDITVLVSSIDVELDAVSCQAGIIDYWGTADGGPHAEVEDDCSSDAEIDKDQSPAAGYVVDVPSTVDVTLTATDAAGHEGSAVTSLTFVDNTDPTANCPADISSASAPGVCGSVVNYVFDATDNCTVDSRSCDYPSGSVFPALLEEGVAAATTVTCTAEDTSGNTDDCDFDVTINDTEYPTIECPENITVGNDPGACGAEVAFDVPTGSDNCGVETVTCDHESGGFFPVILPGAPATTVTCTATDTSGNESASCSFDVTVNDTENPVIICSDEITRPTDRDRCDAVVTFAATVSDNCEAMYSCTPMSGTVFALGDTPVACTGTDTSNNTAVCGFNVNVFDNQPPEVAITGISPDILWPPNHDMIPVTIGVEQTDNCNTLPITVGAYATSSQLDDGRGDGSSTGDVNGSDGYTSPVHIGGYTAAGDGVGSIVADFRAERDGNGGRSSNGVCREYTVLVGATDNAGNESETASATIAVPHDQANGCEDYLGEL